MLKNPQAFTLLEIIIVLIITAVLAGLALPRFTTIVERARGKEAYVKLAEIRRAVINHHELTGIYFHGVLLSDTPELRVDSSNLTYFDANPEIIDPTLSNGCIAAISPLTIEYELIILLDGTIGCRGLSNLQICGQMGYPLFTAC